MCAREGKDSAATAVFAWKLTCYPLDFEVVGDVPKTMLRSLNYRAKRYLCTQNDANSSNSPHQDSPTCEEFPNETSVLRMRMLPAPAFEARRNTKRVPS